MILHSKVFTHMIKLQEYIHFIFQRLFVGKFKLMMLRIY